MTTGRIAVLAACLLALQLLSSPMQARERIISFDSAIELQADSSMTVTETIRVIAEGDQIRRGIYRDFPTDYRDRFNNRIQVGFEVLKVMRDGDSEPFFTERRANGVRVYIGNADRLLPPGEYEYVLTYRTTRQLGYYENHDELYWNVTGNGWAFVIQSASATITLPPGIDRNAIAIEGYTGPSGATEQDYSARVTGDSQATIRSTRPLLPNEGLTVVVSWPKGVVTEPTAVDKAGFLLADNLGLLLALGGLAAMAGYLYFAWARYGRDPRPGPLFPHYEPPPGLSPGACRYILNMSHDHQAFTAAVLNLAVKGYVTLHEGRTAALQAATGGDVYDKALEKLSSLQNTLLGPLIELAGDAIEAAYDDVFVLEQNSPTRDLPKPGPGEAALLARLFESGRFLLLAKSNHQVIRAAIRAHEAALTKYYKRINFLTNGALVLPAVLIAGITVLLIVLQAEITPMVVVTLLAAPVLMVVFARLLKAPTAIGRRTMDQIEGFRMYLQVAEGDDLKRLEGIAGRSPVKTPALFESYLPYAIALDVEQPWAEQFEPLFRRLSAEEGRSFRPGWYNSQKPVTNISSFSTAMSSSLSTAISSSSTAPGSSSGSGGGGSSGGGGGGGGGGGW